MLTASFIHRTFSYNGTILPDPNPQLSIPEVQRIHASTHPELANAKPQVETKDGPNGTTRTITYHTAVGTKG